MLGIPVLCPDETIRHQQILTLKADSIWHPKKYKMVQDPEKQSLGNNMKSQDNPPFQILTQETGGFGTEEDICKEVSCLGKKAWIS